MKTDAVFWKREDGVDGPSGIEPSEGDRQDRAHGGNSAGIDEELTFHPLRIAVLTVSDTRTEETDTSGRLLAGA